MQSNECTFICEQYTDYQENTLSAEIRAQVETHLSVCPLCQKTFNELSGILEKLQQLPPLSTSENFTDQLLLKIQQDKEQGTWTRVLHSGVTRVAGYAVAAGLIVALGINFWLEPVSNNPRGVKSQFASEKSLADPSPNSIAAGGDSITNQVLDSLEIQQTIQSANQKMLLVNDSK